MRRLQGARRDQRRVRADRCAGAPRRRHALLGQPCRGAGAGRAPARHQGLHRHAEQQPQAKRASVARYGGEITYCAATLAAREAAARRLVEATGAAFVHPYDDLMVMAGQATAAAEFLEQVPQLDVILCPVGGGGLLSGTAVAAKTLSPASASSAWNRPAPTMRRARCAPANLCPPAADTIADGLRGALAPSTFAEIRAQVDEI